MKFLFAFILFKSVVSYSQEYVFLSAIDNAQDMTTGFNAIPKVKSNIPYLAATTIESCIGRGACNEVPTTIFISFDVSQIRDALIMGARLKIYDYANPGTISDDPINSNNNFGNDYPSFTIQSGIVSYGENYSTSYSYMSGTKLTQASGRDPFIDVKALLKEAIEDKPEIELITFIIKVNGERIFNSRTSSDETKRPQLEISIALENESYLSTLGLGTNNIPKGYKMAVDGKIIAEGVKVDYSEKWPDYVFDETYELASLDSLESFIQEKKHLPNIPSSKEVAQNGFALEEMNAKLLEKVEELTLYLLEEKKKREEDHQRITQLEQQLHKLTTQDD